MMNLNRAASIVRRSGGSLRATDAMGRADRARRGDESCRLTCLPRWPGEAASPSRFLPSGLPGFLTPVVAFLPGRSTSSGLLAFAEPAVAQTSFTLTSILRLASDGLVISLKVDNAQAFTAGCHSRGNKLSSVDAGMQNGVRPSVYTVGIHSSASSGRPGNTIPGPLTNALTVFRKPDGFPIAVARRSIGNRSYRRTHKTIGPRSQLFPLRVGHVRPRRDTDGAHKQRSGGAQRAAQGHYQLIEALSPRLGPRLFGFTVVLNPEQRG